MRSARIHQTANTGAHINRQRHFTGKCSLYPDQQRAWRDRLPSAKGYYREHVKKLTKANSAGWAQGCCPFHEDKQASMSVNLHHGGWRCFAGCGQGDMLAFHMRLTGKPFAQAVADLTGMQP